MEQNTNTHPVVMDPMHLTHLVSIAMWHHMFVDQAIRNMIYIQAQRVAFDRGPQWEPWNNHRIPHARFVQLFRMSLAYFEWLAEELRDDLPLDAASH
ncbi:hypothetical protein VP01_1361g5 [Puccinia sorghi]|uniref:Uncharacterized protein n=1 Tax=Puccinia sorghi TaxID=27349 RepID=A0A0L6VME1_9BASI|nr:hypothetical protein VP01_1361g5 [Puccinia sorghi]